MPYSRYGNANTRGNDNARAYPSYRNANSIAHARRAVFNVVRARNMYPHYNNRNGVVGGGYPRYDNRNVMCTRRVIAIGVPTNITRNVRLSVGNGNGTNGRGNMPNSLLMLVRRRTRTRLLHSRGSLVCGLLLSVPATALNNATSVPAVSDGIHMGVRPNARPNGMLHLHNGKLPGIGNCNAKSLLIGVDICVPRALDHSRGTTVRGFRGSSGFHPGRDLGRGVFHGFHGLFSWVHVAGVRGNHVGPVQPLLYNVVAARQLSFAVGCCC